MAKVKTSSYILTLKLDIKSYEEDIINKRLEIGRSIYNSVLNIALKRYKLMTESKEYTKTKKQLKNINNLYHDTTSKKEKKQYDKDRKVLYKKLDELKAKYNLTNYSLYADVKPMYKHFKSNIDSLMAQAIADRVWSSLDKMLNSNGNRCYFKRYGEFNSLENKWSKSGMRYIDGAIKWQGLKLPVIIKSNDTYAQKAIQDRVKYCRIVRKEIKGKYKYYVQLILEGIPPMKVNKNTCEIKGSIGIGTVGIDIGTRTIAIASKYDCKLLELAEGLDDISKQERVLSRKLDRQRRVNNPNKYNSDGTIKKGNRDKWIKSNNYLKTQSKLRDIRRRLAAQRKDKHETMANYILSLGDTILVETMSYSGLQARSKNTTVNEKTGKFNKKKRFGKSLANKAPSKLLEIINRKLQYEGLKLYKINTYKVKASQYNPFDECYVKKQLSERWNCFKCENKEIKIQRDLMSALIIKNVIVDKKEKLDIVDRENLLNEFNEFKILHDKEIERIKNCGNKLISSMGI